MAELQAALNTLAGTTGLDAQRAANVWANTSGLDLVDALNARAGLTASSELALQGVLNKLAGTTGRDTNAAAEALLAGRLSAANSGFESGVGDWGVNTNCTRAQSSAQAYAGTNSLALTSLAAGDMSVQILPVTLGVPVTPGQMLDASAQVRAATTGRGTGISIAWWTSVGGWISTTGGTTFPTDTTSGWVQPTCVRAVAPATAAYATPVVVILSTGAAGEVHYVDNVIVR